MWETFADDGVEPVVNSVLVFPQQLHHWVVGAAEDKQDKQVEHNLSDSFVLSSVG